jgi:hypothetical protein
MRLRTILAAGLLLLAGCGLVDEDGAWLSERSAREALRAAAELEARGDLARAAEVYEGLALGFPDQHWAPRALAGAARSREALAARSTGAAAARETRAAALLWERLARLYPGSPEAAGAGERAEDLLPRGARAISPAEAGPEGRRRTP